MAKILSSKDFIEQKKNQLKTRCKNIKLKNIFPKLSVVLVGKNSASLSYVRKKKNFCQEIGALCDIIELGEDITVRDFLKCVDSLNKDNSTQGIIIQLPLPKTLQTIDISSLIIPEKDVDGFHPQNIFNIYYQQEAGFLPCTPAGIMAFLKEHLQLNLEGKLICLIGRSNIVGKPLLHLLNHSNSTVVWCHSKTINLTALTKQADIIITATGVRHFLNQDFFKKDKEQIVIDVGITTGVDGKLAGDLDVESIIDFPLLSYTPVPGGVGPLTVYKLIDNLIIACETQTPPANL